MKTLILGKGYVGSELSKKLDDSVSLSKNDLDYTNPELLESFISENEIRTLINCVGFTGRPNIDECELKKEECWDLNVVLPLKLSKLSKKLKLNHIQISSGCIYDGYYKEWTEEDVPNFGLYDNSSFYSKCKHAYETINDYGMTIRVRMPFGDELTDRNYLKKILNYDNLINFRNSKTYICDLSRFIHYIRNIPFINKAGTINFVNTNPLDTEEVITIMKEYGFNNPNWRMVDIRDLNITSPRSNCVLSVDKMNNLFPDFNINTEEYSLRTALKNYK